MTFTRSAAALGAAVALAGAAAGIAGCGSSSTSASGSSAPAKLVVWRMGASVPSQVTWMNGVVAQFHKQFPQYKKTKVVVDWIPWGNRTTDWTNALTSGKGGPDITELGNTDTPGRRHPGRAGQHHQRRQGLVERLGHHRRQPGQRHGQRPELRGAVVRRRARHLVQQGPVRQGRHHRRPPTTWAQLVSDAKALMKTYPGTYGLGAPSNYTNAIVSFIWGAGGQVAVQSGGKWTAELNSPQSEAGIKFYADLLLTQKVSPAKYIGQTELGAPGATSGGSDEDFAKGTLDMYIDGPWAEASLTAVSTKNESQWASFPIPSENGPNPAPAFAGGSDLGVWAKSANKTAAWDLVSVMDSPSNATTFANSQGFFPEFTSQLSSGDVHQQPDHVGLRQGGRLHPDLSAQLQELGHRRRHRPDHPEHDEGTDAGRQLHRHGEQGQHRTAERAEHRQRVLS